MCAYSCVFMTCVCIRPRTYIRIHAHTYAYMHIHTHTCTYIRIPAHTYAYLHIHTHTYIRMCAYAYVRTCSHKKIAKSPVKSGVFKHFQVNFFEFIFFHLDSIIALTRLRMCAHARIHMRVNLHKKIFHAKNPVKLGFFSTSKIFFEKSEKNC